MILNYIFCHFQSKVGWDRPVSSLPLTKNCQYVYDSINNSIWSYRVSVHYCLIVFVCFLWSTQSMYLLMLNPPKNVKFHLFDLIIVVIPHTYNQRTGGRVSQWQRAHFSPMVSGFNPLCRRWEGQVVLSQMATSPLSPFVVTASNLNGTTYDVKIYNCWSTPSWAQAIFFPEMGGGGFFKIIRSIYSGEIVFASTYESK